MREEADDGLSVDMTTEIYVDKLTFFKGYGRMETIFRLRP
jgi:hypothetical protein